jgi:uncharacterized protein YqeY
VIEEKLREDVKAAMKAGDATRRDALRFMISELGRVEVQRGHKLTEAEVIAEFQKAVKVRRETAEQVRALRPEQATRELAEATLLETYLPRQMSEAEVEAAVTEAIAATGATSKKDLGKVMKEMMARHKGLVDGAVVQRVAAAKLP